VDVQDLDVTAHYMHFLILCTWIIKNCKSNRIQI